MKNWNYGFCKFVSVNNFRSCIYRNIFAQKIYIYMAKVAVGQLISAKK